MNAERQRRRLTTILAADVVGFSRMMAEDEEGTVRTLKSYREIVDGLIERHEGRIFNTAGDAVLAEFPSAVEAVRCAIAFQDELRARNDQRPAAERLVFRIGVNVGDVLEDGDDLLGDGVNVAARLEGLAQPGGVCISESTFAQVKDKLSVAFSDLGAHQVKNMPQPVNAYGIVPGRVEVFDQGGGDEPASSPVGKPTGRRGVLIGAAAALILIAVAAIVFKDDVASTFGVGGDGRDTTEMAAADIQALMRGMRIEGQRRRDGRAFAVVLREGGAADVSLAAADGAEIMDVGRWWTEDGRFCMAVPQLNRGERVCPRIADQDGVLTAFNRAGKALRWKIGR